MGGAFQLGPFLHFCVHAQMAAITVYFFCTYRARGASTARVIKTLLTLWAPHWDFGAPFKLVLLARWEVAFGTAIHAIMS